MFTQKSQLEPGVTKVVGVLMTKDFGMYRALVRKNGRMIESGCFGDPEVRPTIKTSRDTNNEQ